MQAGGQRFESVILHSARKGKKEHIDMLEAKTSKIKLKTANSKQRRTIHTSESQCQFGEVTRKGEKGA